jgi:very-short-patch-repair endonuclease
LRQTSPDAERTLANRLRSRQPDGYKFGRQHPVGPFFADFACIEAGLIVELDGSQHFEPNAMRADAQRTEVLVREGFLLIRFDDRRCGKSLRTGCTSITLTPTLSRKRERE